MRAIVDLMFGIAAAMVVDAVLHDRLPALGICAFEALRGRAPFQSKDTPGGRDRDWSAHLREVGGSSADRRPM